MALFLFAKAIQEVRPIDVINQGKMVRDFTYIDDIVESLIRVLEKPATASSAFDASHPDPASSNAPYRVFNIGNNQPTPIMDYIEALEGAMDKTEVKNYLPMQMGEVPTTAANYGSGSSPIPLSKRVWAGLWSGSQAKPENE